MATQVPGRPVVRDVTLRDGLQLASGILPTEDKLRLARALFANGVESIEIGAVVRPDKVPSMADTLELIGRLTDEERAKSWVLVPNLTGARKAIDAGATQLELVLSVSDEHNRANVGRSTDQSLDDIPQVVEAVKVVGGELQLSLSTAFTCPFAGPIDPEAVHALLDDPRTAQVDGVALCDTIGQATPHDVSALFAQVRKQLGDRWLLFHGHDTWGQGVANSLAALASGADTVDAALGGLGGCPFAPGASGNTALEDVLYAIQPHWLTPERFRRLVLAGQELLEAVGEPQRSRAAEGAARSAGSFEWALATVREPNASPM